VTPPDEPPSNPYDPNWPKPEQPAPTQPYGQDPYGQQPPPASTDQPPYAPYGEQQPPGQDPYGQQQPYGQDPYGQQQPYGQAPYGQQPYPPQGQVPYGAPGYGTLMAPKHPSATTAMVLGIGALGGMFVCGIPIVLAPFAWMIGGRAVKEIDADPGRYSGRDQAQAGRIMGMIGTGLLVLGVLAVVALIAIAVTVGPDTGELVYDPDTGSYTSDPSF
jgi:hypothetical protein